MQKTAKQMLFEAQQYAKEGKWDIVDSDIVPKIPDYKTAQVLKHLYKLFDDKNDDVRDLAGTIADRLDKHQISKSDQVKLKEKLWNGVVKDSHIYARFRAAVAYVDQGFYNRKDVPVLKKVLMEVVEKEKGDIQELALKTIEKIKE